MITPINSMTIEQITERKHDLLVSDKDIHEISRVARLETIEVFAKALKKRYPIAENDLFTINDTLHREIDKIAEQLKKGSAGDGKTM